jgi:hypothetical protein
MRNAKPVDYLKIGDNVYAIEHVAQGIDIETELRNFYADKLTSALNQNSQFIAAAVDREWDYQMGKLIEQTSADRVMLAPENFFKPIYYDKHNKCFSVVKTILYQPNCIKTSSYLLPEFKQFIDPVTTDSTQQVLIYLKQDLIVFPLQIALIKYRNDSYLRVVGDSTTFHCYSDGRICIGYNNAETLWNLDIKALGKRLSSINAFSLASHYNTWGERDERIHIRELAQQKYITDVVFVPNDVDEDGEPIGGTEWNA